MRLLVNIFMISMPIRLHALVYQAFLLISICCLVLTDFVFPAQCLLILAR